MDKISSKLHKPVTHSLYFSACWRYHHWKKWWLLYMKKMTPFREKYRVISSLFSFIFKWKEMWYPLIGISFCIHAILSGIGYEILLQAHETHKPMIRRELSKYSITQKRLSSLDQWQSNCVHFGEPNKRHCVQ